MDSSDGQSTLMNENLNERFTRRSTPRRQSTPSPQHTTKPMTLNSSIRQYLRYHEWHSNTSTWTDLPEVPAATELWAPSEEEVSSELELQENIVVGPYASRNAYLECHYRLLREDAVAPLRDAVREVQLTPALVEKDSENDACIYERVHIKGFTFARTGIAARVSFSLKRIGKQVNWEQSKRLRTGTMLALTPARDQFRTVCRVAIVAARPLAGLIQNPPEIDIYFGQADEIEIDPQEEWMMVESRNGFFEGYRFVGWTVIPEGRFSYKNSRHTLQSLQHLQDEVFPLEKHIVFLNRQIENPEYVKKQPVRDLRHTFPEEGGGDLRVNILQEWPDLPSTLDKSQLEALKRAMTKSLAIIQGPPGTGKTFLSVMLLDLMLQNALPSDAPIIVTAQTNHALDQLLRHVSKFDPSFIRMGSMTQDFDTIKPRTLYEVKRATKQGHLQGGLLAGAAAKMKQLTSEILELLGPLSKCDEVHPPSLFKQYGIITDSQCECLIRGASEWISGGDVSNEMSAWLGEEQIEPNFLVPEDLGFQEIEQDELDYEELQEIEGENKRSDDDDIETLRGTRVLLNEKWTGRETPFTSSKVIAMEIKKQNLWDVPVENRGSAYRLLQHLLKEKIRAKVREKARSYAASVRNVKIGRFEVDYNYLRDARIIGLTTTGLSKYRALIQSLNPKVVLIEEAAETFEAFATAACLPSLQQLILVGDHAQLRGNPSDHGLAGPPFFLDVSLLERMVRNKVDYTQLNIQRRMIPEIRRGLSPIYEDLRDHPSVTQRHPVAGMGGVNTFFFTHTMAESTDDYMSKLNNGEADLISCFFVYLTQNGIPAPSITILTFYQGQRKLLIRKLRERPSLRGQRLKVETVDSYQGEENAIVLLSMVRSNRRNNIGFLANENRACVALSRAQQGFYIFGNARSLCKVSMLWWLVVQCMAAKPCRVGFRLPVTCSNHNNTTFLQDVTDFATMRDGGCLTRCRGQLKCGHACQLNCHPGSHDNVQCQRRCVKLLPCGHQCVEVCSSECTSDCTCTSIENRLPSVATQRLTGAKASNLGQNSVEDQSLSVLSFQKFARGGHIEADEALDRLALEHRAWQQQVQQQEDSELNRRAKAQFDDEFGSPMANTGDLVSLDPLATDTRLLHVRGDGLGGTRSLYREIYHPSLPASARAIHTETDEGGKKSKDSKQPAPLIEF